jgi:hypothetical protein
MGRLYFAWKTQLLLGLVCWSEAFLWQPPHVRKRRCFKLQKYSPETTATTTSVSARTSVKRQKFDDMMERLQDFYRLHGHSLVTPEDGDPALYKWTVSLRANYRHQVIGTTSRSIRMTVLDHPATTNDDTNNNNNTTWTVRPRLSTEKMRKLQQLDFPWNVQSAVWQRRYEQLEQYREKHGHCRVPANNLEYPGLGVWVRNQRREYRKLQLKKSGQLRLSSSTLTPDRLDALQDIGFEWHKSRPQAWEKRYLELEAFRETFGHANVPEDYHENFALGQWCMNQRSAYKLYTYGDASTTALTAERIRKLETLDFRWNYRQHEWYCMLERIKQYYEQYGHLTISTSDESNQDLRLWLILQRHHYHKRRRREFETTTPLTDRRREALEEAIPNFSWKGRDSTGPNKEDWGNLFQAMREKGIAPGARPKQHWFEGINPFSTDVKDRWTDNELLDLWNQQDGDSDGDGDEDGEYA